MTPATVIRLLSVLSSLAVLAGCARGPDTLELTGYSMGTSYSVRIVSTGESIPLDALADSIATRLEELESQFSTYRKASEISRFNVHPGDEWFAVSPEFVEIVTTAMTISELSGGAFDITVGPLVELWGFGASNAPRAVPSQDAIDVLLEATGYDYLEIRESPPALRRTRPGVQLDFSAIAKGFSVDELSELLDEAGLTDYMIEVGGEVRTRGRSADGGDWSIGIESPLADEIGIEIEDVISLRDRAVATSGDYRNYFEHEGQRYSHSLDPRTGWPVSHRLASVSVIDPTAVTADALATALMVLGAEAGYELAVREGIAAIFIERTEEGFPALETPAYETYVSGL